jgi:hypothetical protein
MVGGATKKTKGGLGKLEKPALRFIALRVHVLNRISGRARIDAERFLET